MAWEENPRICLHMQLIAILSRTGVEISKPDLFTMVHIKDELQELFERPVDIVRLRSNMNPILFQQIQRDGIYV